MNNILITGATGNIGQATLKALAKYYGNYIFSRVRVGVRDINKVIKDFKTIPVQTIIFDFEDQSTFEKAFNDIDTLFLMRPPHLGNVKKYFVPLIDAALANGVKHVVYLSVQGVENMKITPHYKIEKLIKESGMYYTFLRPAYFMQNFTTTLKSDFEKGIIYLPAGKAKFNVVDVQDIGKVAAKVLESPELHQNKYYEITGPENFTFKEMASILSGSLNRPIRYISPNLIKFFIQKKKEGTPLAFILVLIMLHYLPKFQKTPVISDNVKKLTGESPSTFHDFAKEVSKA